MNCQCCFGEEAEFEISIPNPTKCQPQKYLLASQSMNNLVRNNVKGEYNKISLRRKNISMKSNPSINQNKFDSIRIHDSLSQRRIPNYHIKIPHPKVIPNNLIINYISPQQNHPHFPIITPQRVCLTPHFHPINPYIPTIIPNPHHQSNPYNELKIKRPQINIRYQQPQSTVKKPISNETTHTSPMPLMSNIQTGPHEIMPLKVQFEEIPTTTRIDSGQNTDKAGVENERRIRIRKSSIEFNREIHFSDDFRGKMSIELKKVNSMGRQMKQQKNGVIQSGRLKEQHIEKMICKRTQSIRGENDSDENDRFSEVVKEQEQIGGGPSRLMTNSENKFEKVAERSGGEYHRSIIWENSRKQSYSQL